MSEVTASNPHGIKSGDTVYHVSNKQQHLGVDYADTAYADCSWFDKISGKYCEARISLMVLKKVPKSTGGGTVFG